MPTLSELIESGVWRKTTQRLFVMVTPECAVKALDKNHPCNRPPQQRVVDHYIGMMVRGEFMDDHPERLLFSHRGRLIDGQHRMRALIAFNGRFRMEVATGIDEKFYPHLNSGKSRDMQDRLDQVAGTRYQKKLMNEMVRAWLALKTGCAGKQSPERMTDLITKWQPEIAQAVEYAEQCKNKTFARRIPKAGVMAAALEAFRLIPKRSKVFFEALASPDCEILQARRLQHRLLYANEIGGGGKGYMQQLYLYTWAALRAYVEDRPIQILHPLRANPREIGVTWSDLVGTDDQNEATA